MTASVRINVAANFAGKLLTGILALALTPLYVRFLGIEAYGLVGMFAAVQGVLSVLDLGLGATLNQRLARLSANPNDDSSQEMRDLVRTFEVVYGAVGLLSGFAVVVSAPWFARHLLHANALPAETVNTAVRLMGIAFAFQWPASLYGGALAGTQRQVLWNGLMVITSLVRSLGALAALLLLGKTVQVFFGWQVIAALLNTGMNYVAVWSTLPPSPTTARFQRRLLRENSRFAIHLTGSSLLAVVLTQVDKFLLGSLLPLAELGYYTFATTVSNALYNVIGPIFTATFPRLSQLVAEERTDDVRILYHKACQLMSLIIVPPALVAALFTPRIMFAWNVSGETAVQAQHLVPWLILGTMFNGLVNMPYALQLSYGWSRFAFIQNCIAVAAIVPLVFGLVTEFGAIGGALGWLTLNAGYVLIGVPFMHRRILKGEYFRWILRDIGNPLAASLLCAGLARLVLPTTLGDRFTVLLELAGIGLATLLAAALSTAYGRQSAAELSSRIRSAAATFAAS